MSRTWWHTNSVETSTTEQSRIYILRRNYWCGIVSSMQGKLEFSDSKCYINTEYPRIQL